MDDVHSDISIKMVESEMTGQKKKNKHTFLNAKIHADNKRCFGDAQVASFIIFGVRPETNI